MGPLPLSSFTPGGGAEGLWLLILLSGGAASSSILLLLLKDRMVGATLDHGFYVQLFGGENLLAPKIRRASGSPALIFLLGLSSPRGMLMHNLKTPTLTTDAK